eukprot:scaffold102699_cov18-Phaeocystis_antarctica.AAC.1
MRRACSPYEAWGAGQRSRFAELAGSCLKDSQTNSIAENHLLRFASRQVAETCGRTEKISPSSTF